MMQKRALVLCLVFSLLLVSSVSAFSLSDFWDDFYGKITGNVINDGCPSGLAAYYKFDGNLVDSSGNGRNGQIKGQVSSTDGKIGQAYHFNAVGTIDIGNIDFSNQQYTISGWVRTTQPGQYQVWRNWISKNDYETTPFELGIDDANNGRTNGPYQEVWIYGQGAPVNIGFNREINMRDGQWHHIVATFKTGEQKLYHNGVLVASYTFSGNLPVTASNINIGGMQLGSYHAPWIGDIDEVAIYNKVLSASEVSDLYNSGSGKDVCSSGVQQPVICNTTRTCVDSDGMNITNKGSVSGSASTICSDGTGGGGGGSPAVDSCVSSNVLRERYCGEGNYSNYTDFDCTSLGSDFACSDGKCIQLQNGIVSIVCNNDNGCVQPTAGFICENNQSCLYQGSSSCINPGTNLSYCNVTQTKQCISCTEGCAEGKCVSPKVVLGNNCTDNELGVSYYTAGTVNYNGQDYKDSCSGDLLTEYACFNNAVFAYPVYNCSFENKICQNGACVANGGGIVTQNCVGCDYENKCIPVGYRLIINGVPSYCDVYGIAPQKVNEENLTKSCQNNYECESNICSSGECVELEGFKAVLVKFVCRITTMFSSEEGAYEKCVAEYVYGANVSRECTEKDWEAFMTNDICPKSGQKTQGWAKIGNCTAGVSHPSSEIVNCTYNMGCNKDTDCPLLMEYVALPFCENNQSCSNSWSSSCINPGTDSSYCNNTQVKQCTPCYDGCLDGVCMKPTSPFYALCLIRDAYTSVPDLNASDVGQGYAKYNLGSVDSYEEAVQKCTDSIYDGVMGNYCSLNSESAQWGISTFNSTTKDAITSGCASSGCNYHSCPTPTCTDSDGGINSSVYGSIDFKILDFEKISKDSCMLVDSYDVNGKPVAFHSTDSCSGIDCYVKEYYCQINPPDADADKMINCLNGCSNGACIASVDLCSNAICGSGESCDSKTGNCISDVVDGRGTISISGKEIIGEGTNFLNEIHSGDVITLNSGEILTVANVVSNTQLTLTSASLGVIGQTGWKASSTSCGNGFINSGEECDGNNFNGKSCANYKSSLGEDFIDGELVCDSSCKIDTIFCVTQRVKDIIQKGYSVSFQTGEDPLNLTQWILSHVNFDASSPSSSLAGQTGVITGNVIREVNTITGFDVGGGVDCSQQSGWVPGEGEYLFDSLPVSGIPKKQFGEICDANGAPSLFLVGRVNALLDPKVMAAIISASIEVAGKDTLSQMQPKVEALKAQLTALAKTQCTSLGCELGTNTPQIKESSTTSTDRTNRKCDPDARKPLGSITAIGRGSTSSESTNNLYKSIDSQKAALLDTPGQYVKTFCRTMECAYTVNFDTVGGTPMQEGKEWVAKAEINAWLGCESKKTPDDCVPPSTMNIKANSQYTCKGECTTDDDCHQTSSVGEMCCSGKCVDDQTDVNNCGTCGNQCGVADGEDCISGECTSCGNGQLDIGELCDASASPSVSSEITCENSVGPGYEGQLNCNSDCTIDTTACYQLCSADSGEGCGGVVPGNGCEKDDGTSGTCSQQSDGSCTCEGTGTTEYCGDGSCNNGETCSSCPQDCGSCPPTEYCGDAQCNNGETCYSCSIDCGQPTAYGCEGSNTGFIASVASAIGNVGEAIGSFFNSIGCSLFGRC